jgi:hypothetical protein
MFQTLELSHVALILRCVGNTQGMAQNDWGNNAAFQVQLVNTCAAYFVKLYVQPWVLSCCLPLVWMRWNCSSNPSTPAVDSRKA